jgi:hypothetical protein
VKRYLLFLQFPLLRFEKLFGDTGWALLGTEHQVPQLFAERSAFLVKETFELNLNLLDFGLQMHISI